MSDWEMVRWIIACKLLMVACWVAPRDDQHVARFFRQIAQAMKQKIEAEKRDG